MNAKAKASLYIRSVKVALEKAVRVGSEIDMPEGSRTAVFSDTALRFMIEDLDKGLAELIEE